MCKNSNFFAVKKFTTATNEVGKITSPLRKRILQSTTFSPACRSFLFPIHPSAYGISHSPHLLPYENLVSITPPCCSERFTYNLPSRIAETSCQPSFFRYVRILCKLPRSAGIFSQFPAHIAGTFS